MAGPLAATKLISDFQELCTFWDELSNNTREEQECLMLVECLEKMRVKWLECYNQCQDLKSRVVVLEKEKAAKNKLVKEQKHQLIEARAQIASLIAKNQGIESDRAELERQIDLVRELLKEEGVLVSEEMQGNYAFLQKKTRRPGHGDSTSLSHTDDIDFDHTGDSSTVDEEPRRSPTTRYANRGLAELKKRRSRSAAVLRRLPKGTKELPSNSNGIPQNNVASDKETPFVRAAGGKSHTGFRRSFSQPHLTPQTILAQNTVTPPRVGKKNQVLTPPSSSSQRTWTSSKDLSSRRHLFTSKKTFLVEHCDYCKKRIHFGNSGLKCRDCHYVSHNECRNLVPLPCVPFASKTGRNQKLCDYTPSVRPMIPSLIIHCVLELERRGLSKEGLYRVPGVNREVQQLLNQFLTSSRGVPSIRYVEDDHVLAGCIKRFLSQLKDPLIPATSWHEFLEAAKKASDNEDGPDSLRQAISDLPVPNRDTLAFLIIHWKKVGENSAKNKMPAENLSKMLAPSVVGYSKENVSTVEAMEETPKQEMVMNSLLRLSLDYWENLVSCEQPDTPLIG